MPSSLFLLTTMSSLLFLQTFFLIQIIAMTIVPSPTPCPQSCGDIAIPLPFGIGSHCSKIKNVELICDSSSNPPILSFMNTKGPTSIKHIDPISRTVTMSCTIRTGYETPYEKICHNIDECSEHGCCKTTSLEVIGEGAYKWSFCFKEIQVDKRTRIALPSSKNTTCQEVHNATCVKMISRAYPCVCFKGYEGSPFKGCGDIYDCIVFEGNPWEQNAICHNLGGYNCSREGDGLRNGSGCTMPYLKKYIALGSAFIAVFGLVCYYFLDYILEVIRVLAMKVVIRVLAMEVRRRQRQD